MKTCIGLVRNGLSAALLSAAACATGANIWSGGGADTNIDTPANWDDAAAPATNGTAAVIFGTGGSTATINTPVSFLGILLNRDANFTLANGGGALTLGAGGLRAVLQTPNSRTYTVAEDVTLAANQGWGVTNNGAGTALLVVSGAVGDGEGAFGITKTGNGVLQLAGNNTYDGATLVRTGGCVRVTHANALGGVAEGTAIERGGWLELSGGITVAEPLAMGGDQILGWQGTLRSTSGSNVWSGPILISNDSARVRASSGSGLVISGGVTGPGTLGFVANPDANALIVFTNAPIKIGAQNFNGHGDTAGTFALSVTGNVWGTMQTVSRVRADVANAFPPASSLELGAGHNLSGSLDLNGNDQTIGQLRVYAVTNSGLRLVTSPTPATLTVNQSSTTTVDIRFSGASGLAKSGTGFLTLAGVSTNTGVMTVNSGVLKFATPAALFNAAPAYWDADHIVVNTGGTLGLAVGGAGEFSAADVTALSALASATGGFQNNGLLGLDTANAPGGVYVLSTVLSNPPYGSSLGLHKLGAGTLALAAANTYSGRTVVTAGKLNVADETALGANPAASAADQLTLSGGTLLTTNTFALDDANRGVTLAAAGGTFETASATTLTVAGTVAGSGALTKAGGGTLALSGANTYTGKTLLNAGKLSIADEAGLGANPAARAADQLTFNGGTLLCPSGFTLDDANRGITVGASGGTFEVDPSSTTVTVAAVIAGSGALNKTGAGTLLLSATNVFNGVATVSAGTLALGHVDALKFGTVDTGVAGTQALSLALPGPVSYTVGALRGSNSVDLGLNTLNLGANSQPAAYYGPLVGGGGLTKVGTGLFTLAGSNSYQGVTTVGSGILRFAAPGALYAADTASWTAEHIVVSNGATLAFQVGGAGEFSASDLDVLAGMGSATGGFLNGALLGLDTANAAGGAFAYSSALGNPAGNALGLHKLGGGTLLPASANTYTGPTWLTGGTLSIDALANGGVASPLGASGTNAFNLVFNGGALRYTGPTAAMDRLFVITNNATAIFEVTQPGTTQTFTQVKGSVLPGGASIVKRGPGTLSFGYDGPGGSAGNYYSTISSYVVEQGSLLYVAGDTVQVNASRLMPQGPAITLHDGVYVGLFMPLSDTGTKSVQTLSYVGTNATAVINQMAFQGPTNNAPSNLKIFDVSDGAAEVDFQLNSSISIWPDGAGSINKALTDFRKDGAGTARLMGTASQYRGTTTLRNGRLIVVGNVFTNVFSPLGTNATAVQLGDAGTASNNVVTLAVDGGAYTVARGLYVYPYTNGALAVFAGLSTNSLHLSGAVTLSNMLQLASAAKGTNALIAAGVISGPGGLSTTGSVVVASSNTYTGLTTVVSGTLRLAASDRLADASPLRLLGGTFATDGFDETLGALDVDGAAALDFGSGASVVRFAHSAGQAWSGTLQVRNWSGSSAGGGADQLFIGVSAAGVTEAQLAKIIPPAGTAAKQLETGEVVFLPKGALMMLR